jgi:sphingolipid delta-4 desaturase
MAEIDGARWHAERRAQILAAHPEVRELFGTDWTTAIWVLVVGGAHVALTLSASRWSWPVVLLVAFFVGAFPAHAMGVLIHETGHNLVFKRPWANKIFCILANVPLAAPGAMEFKFHHDLHHLHLGDGGIKDTQAPTRREDEVVGTSSILKILSFTFGRFVFKGNPANKVKVDGWVIANWIVCGIYAAIVIFGFGAKSFVFGFVAGLAAFGPHTMGARRLSEHLTARRGQPSNSYYGCLNWISFGVGYHVEHHDFPNIPWRRVPKLRKIAPEFYDSLYQVPSWTGLLLSHFFSPRHRVSQYFGCGGPWLEETGPESDDHRPRGLPISS